MTNATAVVPGWVAQLYAKIDAAALDDYIQGYAPDIELRFGAAAPVHGRDAVHAELAAAHAACRMRHQIVNAWEVVGGAVVEVAVTWILPDESTTSFPAVVIFERAGGLITSQRVYAAPVPPPQA